MKIRNGFVSNSSSSSFIVGVDCDVFNGTGLPVERLTLKQYCDEGWIKSELWGAGYECVHLLEESKFVSDDEFMVMFNEKLNKQNNDPIKLPESLWKFYMDNIQPVIRRKDGKYELPKDVSSVWVDAIEQFIVSELPKDFECYVVTAHDGEYVTIGDEGEWFGFGRDMGDVIEQKTYADELYVDAKSSFKKKFGW